MENLKEYYDDINSIFPNDLREFIEFKLSEKVLKIIFCLEVLDTKKYLNMIMNMFLLMVQTSIMK